VTSNQRGKDAMSEIPLLELRGIEKSLDSIKAFEYAASAPADVIKIMIDM
jgi:hypothetical protein